MQHTTKIEKGFYSKQWSAETYIKLNEANRQLKVTTIKSSRGILYTSVQALKIENGSESFMLFQDYNKNVKQYPEVTRVTDKNIGEVHNKSLAIIETFVNEANDFYAKEVSEQEVN